jgi:DNA-binding CsgD family transcriptional regulator
MRKIFTEKELLLNFGSNLFFLDKQISHGVFKIEEVAENLPGIIHLNRSIDFGLNFINKSGAIDLGREKTELYEMGTEFTQLHLHPFSVAKNTAPLLEFYANKDPNETHTFLQHYRSSISAEYKLLLSTTKIFKKQNLFLTVSATPKELGKLNLKLEKVIAEEYFHYQHFQSFKNLTCREKEILKHIASGKTSRRIGEMLFISKETVATHRKNIYRKLEAKNLYELIKFAQAFDLI